MEIYDGDEIHFIGPMEHHEGFYVEEAMKLELERREAEQSN